MDSYRIDPLPLARVDTFIGHNAAGRLSTPSQEAAPLAGSHPRQGEREDAKLQKAAQAFESYFIYTLLKEMQKTTQEGSLFGKGPGGEIYEHLFQQALSDKISTGSNGLGLTKFLMNELQRRGPSAGGERPASVGRGGQEDVVIGNKSMLSGKDVGKIFAGHNVADPLAAPVGAVAGASAPQPLTENDR